MCAQTSDGSSPRREPPTEGAGNAVEAQDLRGAVQQLADELREASLQVIWRQWRALGAGASLAPKRPATHPSATVIDPEALVLASLLRWTEERRLVDLLHDWVARNSDLLSVQRMKNLEADYPEPTRMSLKRPLAWIAAVARDEGKDLRWRAVANTWRTEAESATRDATSPDMPGPTPLPRRREPRSASAPKSRAVRARLDTDASLLLRLRLGLGVGVKADVLGFLLARHLAPATVREIADATGYTVAAVRRAVDDLAAARLIEVREAYPTRYRADRAAWTPVLGLDDPPLPWGYWHECFTFVAAFSSWAQRTQEHPLSPYAMGAQGRELLERHRAAFGNGAVALWQRHLRARDAQEVVRSTVHALAEWMTERA